MAIQDYNRYCITPFWTPESYYTLKYVQEEFNDPKQIAEWTTLGYDPTRLTGAMCDMRQQQPVWNHRIVDQFQRYGWKDIGTSYYRMNPGTVLPSHSDLYKRYIEIFNLQGQEHTIRRAIVFLEDWQSGHYSECCGDPVVNWTAGTVIEWSYNAPHMAANLGTVPRYTLQITGHI